MDKNNQTADKLSISTHIIANTDDTMEAWAVLQKAQVASLHVSAIMKRSSNVNLEFNGVALNVSDTAEITDIYRQYNKAENKIPSKTGNNFAVKCVINLNHKNDMDEARVKSRMLNNVLSGIFNQSVSVEIKMKSPIAQRLSLAAINPAPLLS